MVIQHVNTILKDPLEDQDLLERSAERPQTGRPPVRRRVTSNESLVMIPPNYMSHNPEGE